LGGAQGGMSALRYVRDWAGQKEEEDILIDRDEKDVE
jgi:hypothetical protein